MTDTGSLATQRLQSMVDDAAQIVFFGGAGTSTDSGIPDFRSRDGLYNQVYDWPPEVILSRSFFNANPRQFYRFYRDRVVHPEAVPNPAHYRLAMMEQEGRLTGVITQNIDGLHQMAGSQNVVELHGSIWRNHCLACGAHFDGLSAIMTSQPVPTCSCGGLICPDVVLYEDPLDEAVLAAAVNLLQQADLLIIGGTSLVVYPAAGLVDYFAGDNIVVINKDGSAPGRRRASLVITEPIGQVLGRLNIKPVSPQDASQP